jgi:hypothetical protein
MSDPLPPEVLLLTGAAVVTYAALVGRRGGRWWLVTGVISAGVVAGLSGWAEAMRGQSWFSGLMQTLFAIMVAVGLGFGLVVQAVGRFWPGARWGVLVATGCVAMLAALTGLWLSL